MKKFFELLDKIIILNKIKIIELFHIIKKSNINNIFDLYDIIIILNSKY